MNSSRLALLVGIAVILSPLATFEAVGAAVETPVLSDAKLLKAAGITPLAEDAQSGVAYAKLTPEMEERLSIKAHEWNRCGGYEALPSELGANSAELHSIFAGLHKMEALNQAFLSKKRVLGLRSNPAIEAALHQVSEQNIKSWIDWLSSYPTRYNKAATANDHVLALKAKLERYLAGSQIPVRVDVIDHQSTKQKSLLVRILGSTRQSEVVVLGAHLDSINTEGGKLAPGSDDNASGSADLLEALRILMKQGRPQRTIDIFFYAGEESGLLGSAEIARQYRAANVNVVGVLQLDMTLFPGNGELVITSMTDFTSAWLRQYLAELNDLYLNARIAHDSCGYGCSDHASWYRQGYPTVMPFEATMRTMNHNLHTARDVVDQKSSFRHAAAFCRLALAFAMDLGNSSLTQPSKP